MCSLGWYLTGCEQKAEVAWPPRPFLILQNEASLCNGPGAGGFPWSLGEPGSGGPCVVGATGSVGSWWWGQGPAFRSKPFHCACTYSRMPQQGEGSAAPFRDVWVRLREA